MIYRTTSCKEVIAMISNDFGLDYSGYINRIPEWIATGLNLMKLAVMLEPVKVTKEVVDYKFLLPCDIKLLKYIKYKGYRMDRMGVDNHLEKADLEEQDTTSGNNQLSAETYELSNSNWGSTTFETGDIDIYYRRVPVEYDNITKIYYPLIPDVDEVKLALEWFVIMHILQRGHKHSIYSLNSRDTATNPFMLWEINKKVARNACSTMDSDERKEVSKLLRTFLVNPVAYDNQFFDNVTTLNYTTP